MKDLTASQIVGLLEQKSERGYHVKLKIRKHGAIKEIILALQSTTLPLTRQILCDILGELYAKSAVNILIECLQTSDLKVRCAAADALGKIASPKSGEILFHYFEQQETEIELRSLLSSAVGAAGYRPAIPLLIASLNDSHTGIRLGAAWSLGKLGAHEALEPLKVALANETNVIAKANMRNAITRITSASP